MHLAVLPRASVGFPGGCHLADDGLVRRMRRALVGWLAPFLVVSVLAGAMAKVQHDAAFRHVRCAEHGELTHVAGATPGSSMTLPGAAARAGLSEQGRVGDQEHEHCQLVFAAAAAATRVFLAEAVPFTPPALAEPLATSLRPVAGRAGHLACAPKTSPPVV